MTNEQFQQLLQILGNVGNVVYQMALRQVYIDIVQNFLWATLLFGVSILLWRWVVAQSKIMKKASSGKSDQDWLLGLHVDMSKTLGVIFGAIGSIVGFGLAIGLINNAIGMLISPQWYAIQYLSGFVR